MAYALQQLKTTLLSPKRRNSWTAEDKKQLKSLSHFEKIHCNVVWMYAQAQNTDICIVMLMDGWSSQATMFHLL